MRLLLTPLRRLPDALRYPLITVGLIAALEVFDHLVGGLRNPMVIYLLVNVVVAFLGGVRAGLISAAISFAHGLHFYATPGQPLLYTEARLDQLVALLVAAPGTALLAGVLRHRTQEREPRFHALFDNALDAMLIFDDKGRYLDVNPAACALFGESRAALVGRNMGGALVPGMAADFQQAWVRFLAEGTLHGEFRVLRADGAVRSVAFNARAHFQPGCHLAVVRDLTEHKLAEAALRASEERFATIFRANPVALTIISFTDGRYLDVNAGFLELTGYRREELIGRTPFELQMWNNPEEMSSIAQILRECGSVRGRESQMRRKSGEVRDTLFSLEVVELGGESCILASTYDITDRKRAEAALRESEARFSLVFHASPETITLSTLDDGCFVDVNETFLQLSGYTREEVINHGTYDLKLWPKPDQRAGIIADLRKGRAMRDIEIPLRIKAGEVREMRASFELVELGGVTYLLAMGNDITERKQAEVALRESEEKYRALVETTNEWIWSLDHAGRFTYSNQAVEAILGYRPDEVIGRDCLQMLHDEDQPHVAGALSGFKTVKSGWQDWVSRWRHKDGTFRYLESNAVPVLDAVGELVGWRGADHDITAAKQAEQALQQANAKLENWVNELEQRNHEGALLNEMGDLLQTCRTIEEAYEVMAHAAQRLFPADSGAFALIANSRNLAETAVVWGAVPPRERVFGPDECWALRRGRVHRIEDPRQGLICPHIHGPLETGALCVPMVAQGETLGVFHLRFAQPPPGQSTALTRSLLDAKQRLAVTVAEHTALALANLRLRESLRSQAIRDPLTGLFNRRYMEESLEREIRRAERNDVPLGIIMLDLDHFKHFNDTFGHAAGDTLLRELGAFLRAHIREADIACRYGGEEFILVFPDASREDVRWRAEQLREAVKHLDVQHRGQPLGGVTLSLGVAVFPEHGMTADDLLFAADNALYIAKGDGRDRVVVALRREPARPARSA